MARPDKLPSDPGLPRQEDFGDWRRALMVRTYSFLTRLIVAVNLLIDGYVLNITTLPTASVTHRGRMVYVPGAAGVTDELFICLKSAADTYTWRSIITGG